MRCERPYATGFGESPCWSESVILFTNRSQDYYEDPIEFKGFRFVELREKEAAGLESLQHQMVSLDPTYMLFGYGRNAWCVVSARSVSSPNWTSHRVAPVGSLP